MAQEFDTNKRKELEESYNVLGTLVKDKQFNTKEPVFMMNMFRLVAKRWERLKLIDALPTSTATNARVDLPNEILRMMNNEQELINNMETIDKTKEALEGDRELFQELLASNKNSAVHNGALLKKELAADRQANEHRCKRGEVAQGAPRQKLNAEVAGRAGISNRKYLLSDGFEAYYNSGMDELLGLRLRDAQTQSSIQILKSYLIKSSSAEADLDRLSSDIVTALKADSNQTIVMPLLIPVVQELNNMHWVGIVVQNNGNRIKITYLDSENQPPYPSLDQKIISKIGAANNKADLSFDQAGLETQKYNNCGPELIENIAKLLSGTRVSQEQAIPLHSLLYEAKLKGEVVDSKKAIGQLSSVLILMCQQFSGQFAKQYFVLFHTLLVKSNY